MNRTATVDRMRGWLLEPPVAEGWAWHWDGVADNAPRPVKVELSVFRNKCFIPAGQLGLAEDVFCIDYGGYWHALVPPALPN